MPLLPPALQRGPFMYKPNYEAPNGLPEERHVLSNQQKAHWKELNADDRQEPQKACNDEQHANGNTDPTGLRIAQPLDGASHAGRHLTLNVLVGLINLAAVLYCHSDPTGLST